MAQQREYYNAVDWLKSAVGIATAEVDRSDTLQSPLGESRFSKRVRGNDDEIRTDPWQGDPMLCACGVIGIAQTKDFERTAANAAARRPESVETRGQAGHVLSYEQSPPQR